ncbi:putative PAP2 domain protein [Trachipleistophora hominis]|uniref:Putative PAP2 domain protein n=1 Tax=Trachipleistophora hominis TaxID=72359 RepID=L7JXL8_TRAHO|nr:putative PAP2 domain protein [Trachipleistophora hominis]
MSKKCFLFTTFILSIILYTTIHFLPIRIVTNTTTRPSTYPSQLLMLSVYITPIGVFAWQIYRNKYTSTVFLVYYAGLFITETLTHVIKLCVREKRPYWQQERRGMESFPSGHSSDMFYMATMFMNESIVCTSAFYVWAVVVGTTRVIDGKHFVWDVVGGALLGLMVGWGMKRVFGSLYIK